MEIEATDVVRLVLQFLKEHSLTSSLRALQEESQVALNTVDNLEGFLGDVQHGRWDAVMSVVATLKLPQALLANLYEQLIVELIEMRELEMARTLLQTADPMLRLREEESERHAKLEALAAKPYFDPRDVYGEEAASGASGGGGQHAGKERRRNELAEQLREQVSVVPPARLLALLGQALKWQQHQGCLPSGERYDLFRDAPATRAVEPETYVTTLGAVAKFGKKSHAECACFSPDGAFLVSGSVDGFVEVWDYERGKVRKDLDYQARDEFMMHDAPVLALAFSGDSELLASASQDGHIKVWRVRTGQCLRRFPAAHSQGVTCLCFSRDGTTLASGSFDALARAHGLRSGKAIKEFRGHTSYINALAYSPDGSRLVSASSDGSVKVWDAKSSECTCTLAPPSPAAGAPPGVNGIAFVPGRPDQLVVCNRSPHLYLMSLSGELLQTLSSGKREGGDFVACAVSSRGGWLHCIGEDAHLYSFDAHEGKLQNLLAAHDKGPIGVAIHPHRNIVATWAEEGTLKLWHANGGA